MIDGFLHPGLALGALAALVPLIIHLLNRRRHRPMAFGAMRFVLAAHKRTRRRAQLENWLLLLLRMAAVALLALAIARPFLGRDALLGPLTESRRHLVILLDASASTGYRDALDSSFERILDSARVELGKLEGGRGDRVHLILGDDRPRLLSWREPSEALSLLETLEEPSDGQFDLAAGLALVREALGTSAIDPATSDVEMILFTDLQRRLFLSENEAEFAALNLPGEAAGATGDGAIDDGAMDDGSTAAGATVDATAADSTGGDPPAEEQDGWRAELSRLAEAGIRLKVADLGPPLERPDNVGLVEIRLANEPRVPGDAVEVAVVVRNHGGRQRTGVRVALSLDGSRLPSQTLDVGPESTEEARFRIAPAQPGDHLLFAELEPDGLAFDDSRAGIVTVPSPIRVLAVNGAPDPESLELDELGLLTFALLPPEDDALRAGDGPFDLTVVERGELGSGRYPLADYDFFLLANVDSLPTRVLEELEEQVRAGAGILFAMGDRVDPNEYAERFFESDGTGLLPAEPIARRAVPSRRTDYFRIADFDGQSEILSFFEDDRWRPYLTEIPFFEFMAVRPLEDARVLARLDERTLEDLGAPLLIERAFGLGRTYLWTSTLDPAWTRLPLSPRTSIPLFHELVRAGGTLRGPAREVELGSPLIAEVDLFPRSPVVVRPDGTRRSLEDEPRELAGGRFRLNLVERAEESGVWQLETEEGPARPFAVLVDPAEGDLERLEPSALPQLHPALSLLDRELASADADSPVAAQGELWRFAAAACLAALVLDSLLGAFLGFRRSGQSLRRSGGTA